MIDSGEAAPYEPSVEQLSDVVGGSPDPRNAAIVGQVLQYCAKRWTPTRMGHSTNAVCHSVCLLPVSALVFATDLPPNSPERRENPASTDRVVPQESPVNKRRGGDSNPRDRLRGPTVFETAAFNRSATSPYRLGS